MIRVAVPKGRLWNHSQEFLRRLGFSSELDPRFYAHRNDDLALEAVTLKLADIPLAVDRGLVDFAIASDEWLIEWSARHRPLVPLCWFHTHICVLSPASDGLVMAEEGMPVVATSYPNIARRHLGDDVQVMTVSGSVEAYPGRMSTIAVDCVETGATAARNGLTVLATLGACDVRLSSSLKADVASAQGQAICAAALQTSLDPGCRFAWIKRSS